MPWKVFVAVLLVLGSAGAKLRSAEQPGPCVVVHGPTALPEIPEASGLAMSRRTPGILWTHNDSGETTVLFAVDVAGGVRGRVRLPIRTRDWEDISAARCPSGDCLYLADIGDNRLTGRRLEIYRVPEPSPDEAQTLRPEAFTVAYSDGAHNAEAAFVIDDTLFVITRDARGGLYRSKVPFSSSTELTLERIGELGLASVTDAEASPDAAWVVARTSSEAIVYRATDLIRAIANPALRIPIDGLQEPQGEGVAFDPGGMLYLASEGPSETRAGRIMGLRCNMTALAADR